MQTILHIALQEQDDVNAFPFMCPWLQSMLQFKGPLIAIMGTI
jgi:hypothetical protein